MECEAGPTFQMRFNSANGLLLLLWRGAWAWGAGCPRALPEGFHTFWETLDKFSVVLYAALDEATFKAPKAGRRAGKGRKGEKGGDREQGPRGGFGPEGRAGFGGGSQGERADKPWGGILLFSNCFFLFLFLHFSYF